MLCCNERAAGLNGIPKPGSNSMVLRGECLPASGMKAGERPKYWPASLGWWRGKVLWFILMNVGNKIYEDDLRRRRCCNKLLDAVPSCRQAAETLPKTSWFVREAENLYVSYYEERYVFVPYSLNAHGSLTDSYMGKGKAIKMSEWMTFAYLAKKCPESSDYLDHQNIALYITIQSAQNSSQEILRSLLFYPKIQKSRWTKSLFRPLTSPHHSKQLLLWQLVTRSSFFQRVEEKDPKAHKHHERLKWATHFSLPLQKTEGRNMILYQYEVCFNDHFLKNVILVDVVLQYFWMLDLSCLGTWFAKFVFI